MFPAKYQISSLPFNQIDYLWPMDKYCLRINTKGVFKLNLNSNTVNKIPVGALFASKEGVMIYKTILRG